jgi:uncharacterized protein YfaS (alpha-2-macroglobulin family)
MYWKAAAASALSAAVFALAVGASRPGGFGGQDDALAKADKAFADKTYQAALDAYRAAEKDPRFAAEQDRVAVRIGECLARLNRGDEALASLKAHIDLAPSSRGARLALLERGVVALTMPHQYYEKDGKRSRGEWVQGGTYHWTEADDLLGGVRDLEAARALGLKHAAEGGAAWTAADRRAHARALLELAAGLEQLHRGRTALGDDRRDPADAAYGALKTWLDRLFVVFDEAVATQAALGDAQGEALALYLKATAARRVIGSHEIRDGALRIHDANGSYAPIPDARNPLLIAAAAREKARGLPSEDSFVFGLARVRHELGAYLDAVKTYKELRDGFRNSTYVGDAKSALEEITFPQFAVAQQPTVAPNTPVKVAATGRNVVEIDLALYRIDAGKTWLSDSFLNDGDFELLNFDHLLKESGWKPRDADRVHAAKVPTGDVADHRPLAFDLPLPALPAGTYVLRTEAGGIVNLSPVYVTDLVVVAKTDETRTLVYVADGPTGKPVKGADVVVRERWQTKGLFGWSWKERHLRGTTDERGIFVRPHDAARGPTNSHAETVVVDGPRTALAPPAYIWTSVPEGRDLNAYVMTDRPVYRPGDPTRIAAVLTRWENDGRVAFADRPVRMEVRDPKGAVLFNQELRTDKDGAVAQEIVLGKEPPLGQYSVYVYHDRTQLRYAWFRVEEYLKPEFEVRVEPAQEELRLGGKGKATIVADYYFGGGVAGGQVAWKVLRDAWRPTFRRADPWRAFYGVSTEDLGPATDAAGRELVASGNGTMGSDGRLEIAFDTAAYAAAEGDGSSFVVQAEVTDSSRRTISAEDAVVVAKRGLSFDLRPRKGFFRVGENVEVELQSVLPSGAPAAAKGTFKTAKINPAVLDEQGRVKVEEVRAELAAAAGEADDKGVGFFRTLFDEPGYYAVRFEALDRFEQLCFAEVRFWVSAPNFRADGFEMKNLELIAERRTWKPGETAAVLVHADLPDCAVLLTIEAGRRILGSQVLFLTGKTALLELPILKEHAPNVHVRAATVRGNRVFEESLELFVPPVEKFLNVGVAYGKPEYRPGELGDLVVTTTNVAGAPVAARAVVTVLDASLFYVQNDVTPDMRRFFYGQRRWQGVNSATSIGLHFAALVRSSVKYGEYEGVGAPPAWNTGPGVASRLLAGGPLSSEVFAESDSWGVEGGFMGGRKPGAKRSLLRSLAAGDDATPGSAAAAAPREESKSAEEGELTDSSTRRLRDAPGDKDGEDGGAAPAIALRTDFRDSALWATDVRTDASGRATVKVPFPDSTTRWRAKAWSWTPDLMVGEGTADVATTKNLVARLRAPRFFVEGDLVTVSASINNRGGSALAAQVELDLGADGLLAASEPLRRTVDVPSKGVGTIDWRVRVLRAGSAKIGLKAWSGDEADGLAKSFPVFEWGAEKRLFDGAVLEAGAARTLAFEIPAERRPETGRLSVVLQPSLALTLVDALPYLIEYPYGCTEQTVSRFVPAAVVARTLREAGTTLSDVLKKRADLPKADLQGAGREKKTGAFDLDDVVRAGLARLRLLRHSDGGFGWWQNDRSSVYMTAYVLQGLVIAREADVAVDEGLISGAVGYLTGVLDKETSLETAVFGAYALARAGKPHAKVADLAFKERDRLSLYGKALLASALQAGGKHDEAALIVRAFDDVAKQDEANGTTHFGANAGGWWFWWNSRIETNAAVLHALLDVDPRNAHAAPLAKWLALNRRGNRWSNTRDTAHAIFALVRYAKATGELDPELDVEVDVPGAPTKKFRIDRTNLFAFDNAVVVSGDAVRTGRAEIVVRTKGKGRLYVAAEAGFFTKESEIASAGRELFVEREYVKVVSESKEAEVDGRKTTVVSERFEPLLPGAVLASGDVVEVRLKIDAKNDYEHLLFEDLKPAGFEPLEVRSGGNYQNGICSNVEFRDAKTALFATWLEQGRHTLSYRLRAELPGELRAAPARGEAMYAPDVAGTSSSFRFTVKDAPSAK